MFYYPTVLRRHSGCFSTIWLVATKGIRVTRRDYLKVNINRTCEDIMDYILAQVPPPAPGLPTPRLSLYLSSQLQYGVVLVFHRQCDIFLEELQTVLGRLVKRTKTQDLDLDERGRKIQDFPDALALMEEFEGAPDPLFGVMDMRGSMPSPSTLIQMGKEFLRESSPELPALEDDGITATQESITLQETERLAIPVAEFEGDDLIEPLPEMINFLMAHTDHLFEAEDLRDEGTLGEQERETERGREEDLETRGAAEPSASMIELPPAAALFDEDAQEESAERPRPPAEEVTPVSVPPMPSPRPARRARPQAEDVFPAVAKTRKRKKRQLIFFDRETQIPPDVFQQQISNPHIATRPHLLQPPASQAMLSAAELFRRPCNFLPDEILSLWRQAATITPLSGSELQAGERGPESTDSEREREQRGTEAAEAAEAAEATERERRAEPSPMEVHRDASSHMMSDSSAPGFLPQDGSDPHVSLIDATERDGSVSKLHDIQEVPDEMPEGVTTMYPGSEHEAEPVLFRSLLPPEVDRLTVSSIFMKLLENLSANKVLAEQEEPYGDISILPGPEYEQACMAL